MIVEKDLSNFVKDVKELKSLGVDVMTLDADVAKFEEACRVKEILYQNFQNVDFLVRKRIIFI